MINELVSKNRSYRRFYEDVTIKRETLKELVNLARLSASAENKQPLRFILSSEPETNKKIFPTLGWAYYLKDWKGPKKGERPAAYIIILGDTEINSRYINVDYGIAAQNITLGATENGYGSCMLAAINRTELRKALKIPERYKILLVVALGKPKETVVIDKIGPDGSIEYWRDENDVHHVPKRSLEDIILE